MATKTLPFPLIESSFTWAKVQYTFQPEMVFPSPRCQELQVPYVCLELSHGIGFQGIIEVALGRIVSSATLFGVLDLWDKFARSIALVSVKDWHPICLV
jgi:hypothetical protein